VLSPVSVGRPGLAGSNESAFVGEHDGLDAVAEVEFGEDPVDVRLHGGLGGDEVPGDLGVGESVRDQAQDFRFAFGERAQFGGKRAESGAAYVLLDQAAGDRRREERLAGRDESHGLDKAADGALFEHSRWRRPRARRERSF
jgi:hypothetical protein